MSWSEVTVWPGDTSGDPAYRVAAEPVIARYDRLEASELRFLQSRNPIGWRKRYTVARAALTQDFLYVERVDGTQMRTPADSLLGLRFVNFMWSRRRLAVVGVAGVESEGEWVELLCRDDCPLLSALTERLPHGEYRFTHPVDPSAKWIISALLLTLSFVIYFAAPAVSTLEGLDADVRAGCAAFIFAVAALTSSPRHFVLDSLGLRYGHLLGGLQVRRRVPVRCYRQFTLIKNQTSRIRLELSKPRQLGRWWRSNSLVLPQRYEAEEVASAINDLCDIYSPPGQLASTTDFVAQTRGVLISIAMVVIAALVGVGLTVSHGEEQRAWHRDPLADRERCAQGDGEACYYAGWASQQGLGGMEQDETQATSLYDLGCDYDYAHACYGRGQMAGNDGTAFYIRACELGDEGSCYAAGPPWDGTGDVPPPQWGLGADESGPADEEEEP